jgi:hypothetical protein
MHVGVAILALLLTLVQLSTSPEEVFSHIKSVLYFSATVIAKIFQCHGTDKAPADPAPRWSPWVKVPTKVLNTKICCESFRSGFFSLTESNILNPCYEIWE